jgi:uncharacterized OB-fold protein
MEVRRFYWKGNNQMVTPYVPRAIPAPTVLPDNIGFWEAANEGRLLIRRCDSCKGSHWFPRPHCPFCFNDATGWQESSGVGVIYSFSVTRVGVKTPYAIAYVTLAEGPTMMSNIVDCDLDSIQVGQAVRVVFKPSDGNLLIPMFAPE